MRLIRHSTLTLAALAMLIGAVWFATDLVEPEAPSETAIEAAYRLCAECGLSHDETDQLVDDAAHSTLTRKELVELFLDTFEMRADAEQCLPCVEVVLDAAAAQAGGEAAV